MRYVWRCVRGKPWTAINVPNARPGNAISWPVSATANFLLKYCPRGKGRRCSSARQKFRSVTAKTWCISFICRLDEEIARIEIPQWVAQDEKRLNLVHTLVLDQCRRGQGYPVALGEAHEKAVITGADRENFWQMVESSLIAEHLPTSGSAKSQSKKTRWV